MPAVRIDDVANPDPGETNYTPGPSRNERLRQLFDLELNAEDQTLFNDELNSVAVLIKWISDDLNLDAEIQGLADVLTKTYDCDLKRLQLEDEGAQNQLKSFLDETIATQVKSDCKRLIVYYGGHGSRGHLGELLLKGSRNQKSAPIEWEPIEKLLRGSPLDVLVILDCCEAGNRPERRFRPREKSESDTDSTVNNHKFEVLCATGAAKEAIAIPSGEGRDMLVTFTQALTWALYQLSDGSIFTTALLLQTLFSNPNFPINQYPELWKDGPYEQPYFTLISSHHSKLHGETSTDIMHNAKEGTFDLRFHVTNRPNELQLRNLISTLKNMSKQGIFTPRRVEWLEFDANDISTRDPNTEEAIDFRLFDSKAEHGTLHSFDSNSSDDFIARIRNHVHKELPGYEEPHRSPSEPLRDFLSRREDHKRQEEIRQVKIAIIDTGFDSKHPVFEWAPNNVFDNPHETFVWVPPNALRENINPSPYHDSHGHGTHGTSILSMLAPKAQVFVAKVVDGDRYREKMAASVREAIKHACDKWKVDIITMSFGFPYSDRRLEAAIKKAKETTLMFASASNDGANPATPITFPASAPGVFCIHSTDGYGKPSKFTPYAQPGTDNFATLGESVRAAWPTHMGMGLERRLSGTSTATPIAAAIAALVLDLAFNNEEISDEERQKIKSYDGMKAVLMSMAATDGGYHYLNPHWFFTEHLSERSDRPSPQRMIKDALKDVELEDIPREGGPRSTSTDQSQPSSVVCR